MKISPLLEVATAHAWLFTFTTDSSLEVVAPNEAALGCTMSRKSLAFPRRLERKGTVTSPGKAKGNKLYAG